MRLTREKFDELVGQAIESLEGQFRVHLEDVPVIVEDYPDEKTCRSVKIRNPGRLLGVFRGVPLNCRSVEGNISGPQQIILYRDNILSFCRNRRQLAEQIRKTVVHELGHYLGFSEGQLRGYHY